MDSTFIPVTITFFAFIGISYYLNVIRLSVPIIMIYFIYCFSNFIKNDQVVSVNQKIIREKSSENIKNDNIAKLNDTATYKLESTIDFDNIPVDPKPIVSSSPKPIVIDSNLVSKKDIIINENSSESLVITEPIDKENNKNLKPTLKLNEIMICRGIYKRNPIKPGVKFINNVDSLFCYTKISNSGNKQEVKHIWYFENKEVTTVSYNIKTSYNYRSWSKKTIYPNQTGKWRVDVVTRFGEILGSRDFSINSISTTY
tara:strand:- start:332 stop:1102 length:771 start_codon:yes stop_codon:yes gene_type:complete